MLSAGLPAGSCGSEHRRYVVISSRRLCHFEPQARNLAFVFVGLGEKERSLVALGMTRKGFGMTKTAGMTGKRFRDDKNYLR